MEKQERSHIIEALLTAVIGIVLSSLANNHLSGTERNIVICTSVTGVAFIIWKEFEIRRWFIVSILRAIPAAFWLWCAWQYGHEFRRQQALEKFRPKIQQLAWVAYEPIGLNPYDPGSSAVTDADIERELVALGNKGHFTGIITFGADPIGAKIPHLASTHFKGVIMGLSSVSADEIKLAIDNAEYVDAYCVMHNLGGTSAPVSPSQLLEAMQVIRSRTGKPVTTTLKPDAYRVYPELAEVSDFLFPDVHGSWYGEADPNRIEAETIQLVDKIAGIRNERYSKKPILLKMLSFPTCGEAQGSEESQRAFAGKVYRDFVSSANAPADVYLSWFSAFDTKWKTPAHGWMRGETCLGLFRDDLTARPAVAVINQPGLPPRPPLPGN